MAQHYAVSGLRQRAEASATLLEAEALSAPLEGLGWRQIELKAQS